MMELGEFMDKAAENQSKALEELSAAEQIDVQKIVVGELAADKVRQAEELEALRLRVSELEAQLLRSEEAGRRQADRLAAAQEAASEAERSLRTRVAELDARAESLAHENARLQSRLAALQAQEADGQERNPNALALLDRDVDLPDRFPGETRDHVLEVIREARVRAEAEGRLRRAQVLEGVLLCNEPNGTLAQRRRTLQKLIVENGNLVTGAVLGELQARGLSNRNGETYLLPSEIVARNY